MNFTHTEDRRMLADSLNRFVSEQYGIEHRNQLAYGQEGHSPALYAQFAELASQQIDVVVDYLWGHSAELLLPILAKRSPGQSSIRYVQVGSLAGADISINGAVLRSAPLQLMGSGIGSLSMPELLQATGEMLQAAAIGGFTIATTPARLCDVATAWPMDNSQKRTVFLVE